MPDFNEKSLVLAGISVGVLVLISGLGLFATKADVEAVKTGCAEKYVTREEVVERLNVLIKQVDVLSERLNRVR